MNTTLQRSLFVLAALLPASVSYGQDRATLRGTITNASGGVVAATHVVLDSPATGLHRETLSGSLGIDVFSALPVGAYQVEISKDGFRQATVSDIVLQFAGIRTVDSQRTDF